MRHRATCRSSARGPRGPDRRPAAWYRVAVRDPVRELTDDEKFEMPPLPEPASYDQLLVAISQLDPLEQEVMIANGCPRCRHRRTAACR